MQEMRLNKYLSEMGVCSRREADRLVEEGKILVDGKPARMGQKVTEGQEIICCKKRVEQKDPPILLAVNKPRGIVCTTSEKDRAENIVEFLNYPCRIYPVGRLDKDSEGLLLMTNQGDLVNKIMRAGNYHEKEYEVVVDKPVTGEFLNKMASGVAILDTITRPCTIQKLGKNKFSIILTQGLNRQIRRMCGALGYHVLELKRIRIMNLELGNLKTGEYRKITPKEGEKLRALLEDSCSGPATQNSGKVQAKISKGRKKKG